MEGEISEILQTYYYFKVAIWGLVDIFVSYGMIDN